MKKKTGVIDAFDKAHLCCGNTVDKNSFFFHYHSLPFTKYSTGVNDIFANLERECIIFTMSE